ncbi:MAG TPA: sulfatase-like hydrolase/transferase, partial [Bacteroidales bacterium]|nr:sulfatase-like hydrolase/transferase [Bacteroidales bacterium]
AFTNIIGVDEYYGKDEYNNNADFDGIWGIWDEPFMQYYAAQLDTFRQPFVAALFSVSSHHPFKLPEKYKDRFKGDDFPLQKCIRYTDYSLRRFFQTASKMPWFKNTLFVITADHVSLNQRPEYKNNVGYFSIPIIFYKPGSDLVGIDSVTNAQQIDIMPTILDYLGYDKDYVAFGKDLFHTRRPNFTINYLNGTYRLFLNNYLLISDGNKPLELYNVVNDRQVSANIMDQHPEQTATMMKFMKAFIQQYNNRLIENRMVPGR